MNEAEAFAPGGGSSIGSVVFDEEAIRTRVAELGAEITAAYTPDDRLLLLGVLKGSFIFLADLVRAIHLPLHVDFLVASSYGTEVESSGEVEFRYDPTASLEGRAVLVVEDIIDSGVTLERVIPRLSARGATRVDVCALLHKRLATTSIEPRWAGFDAPNSFLVGYGLDHAEHFRHLPYIASLRVGSMPGQRPPADNDGTRPNKA
jgi:hypoxanthine phosphoribosyltransferase